MAGERPKPRYEDVGLLVGGMFAGVGVKGLSDVYGSWAMFLLGMLIIAWVLVRREYDARPPWVKGDSGIQIRKPKFEGCSVTFTAVLYNPREDLWIACDAPVVAGQGSVKQTIAGATRQGVPTWPVYHDGKGALVWLSADPPDDEPYQKDVKVIELEIEATQPLRRVQVGVATPRQKRRMIKKWPPMRSVALPPPTASGQAPPSSPGSSE